jgi:hypothetical protein
VADADPTVCARPREGGVRSPGRAVRRLQRPFGIAADGAFATFRVVRRFQRAHGTPAGLTLSRLAVLDDDMLFLRGGIDALQDN